MITVEEIEISARDNATQIMERFYPTEARDTPLQDLLVAAYVAGANRAIKSMLTAGDDDNDNR